MLKRRTRDLAADARKTNKTKMITERIIFGRSEIIKFIILLPLFHALEKSIGIPPTINCIVVLMQINPDFAVGDFSQLPASNGLFSDYKNGIALFVHRADTLRRLKYSRALFLLEHLSIAPGTFTFLPLYSNSSEVAYCRPSDG
jgi:hypothetical protein